MIFQQFLSHSRKTQLKIGWQLIFHFRTFLDLDGISVLGIFVPLIVECQTTDHPHWSQLWSKSHLYNGLPFSILDWEGHHWVFKHTLVVLNRLISCSHYLHSYHKFKVKAFNWVANLSRGMFGSWREFEASELLHHVVKKVSVKFLPKKSKVFRMQFNLQKWSMAL